MDLNKTFPFADLKFSEDFKNKSWVEIIEEEENRREAELSKKIESNVGKPEVVSSNPRVELNTNVSSGSRPNRKRLLPTPKTEWVVPNKGWCWKEETITRRDKEIQKMKDRATYLRYIEQVPKSTRKKGIHPRTPNKFLNWSRRSWDKQVKLWKLAIYEWAGESPTSSVYGSYCSSECSDEERATSVDASTSMDKPSTSKRIKREEKVIELKNKTISIPSADNMASLLGHFDLDTLREAPTIMSTTGDESTLKASPKSNGPVTRSKSYASVAASCKSIKGPTDFSHLILKDSATNKERKREENK